MAPLGCCFRTSPVPLYRSASHDDVMMRRQVWDGMCGRMATFRYEQLHQQQLLNWGLEERGRFSSYRGILSVRTYLSLRHYYL